MISIVDRAAPWRPTAADGVGVAEELLRERLVDDADARRRLVIFRAEAAAAEDADPHDVEVARRDRVDEGSLCDAGGGWNPSTEITLPTIRP